MDELHATVASNLIRLRTKAGLTQAELGQLIHYSDKSVSKWERGESIPDVQVLKMLADYYQLTVDDIITPYNESEPKLYNKTAAAVRSINTDAVITVSLLGVWTMALSIFVVLWLFGIILWQIFVLAVPVSLIVYLVLHSIWYEGKYNYYIISCLVASLFVLIYVICAQFHPWQIFLLLIPAEVIVFFSFRVDNSKKSSQKH